MRAAASGAGKKDTRESSPRQSLQPMTGRKALIAVLPEFPKAVFVSCSMAE